MDAIAYLKQEHNKFRRALKTIANIANEKAKVNKFNAFCKDLQRHEAMEENVWYPVLRRVPELRDIIRHLISEEKSAAKAIAKLKQTDFGVLWKLKFYKFKHDVDHHANDEEKELFPEVRKFIDKAELNALGVKMRKFKASLKKK